MAVKVDVSAIHIEHDFPVGGSPRRGQGHGRCSGALRNCNTLWVRRSGCVESTDNRHCQFRTQDLRQPFSLKS